MKGCVHTYKTWLPGVFTISFHKNSLFPFTLVGYYITLQMTNLTNYVFNYIFFFKAGSFNMGV